MSYRIDYCTKKKLLRDGLFRLSVLTILSFMLFLLLVNAMWPEGTALIHESVYQLRMRTAAALNLLEENYQNREQLTAVFSDLIQSFQHDSK